MSSKFAIVGMSCLFPGADTPGAFWDNLRAGVDSRAEGGPEIFGPTGPGPADSRMQAPDPDHAITCVRGGFVTGFEFDPTGFLLRPEDLAGLDRVFHWSLHVAREALRDSGHDNRPELLARTGLVVGDYSFPTPASARINLPLVHEAVLEGLRRSGNPAPDPGPLLDPATVSPADARVSGAPARLAATALGLGGPRYALDAACSSALYALKLACDHLAAGQADLVLAGGVCAPDPTLIHLSFSDLHAYPQNGVSQPFDARSTGILTGQGAGMVAVRRLADAIADGDRVYAVIDGIGLSNDGAGRHLLVPNPAGQLSAYELAYAQAGFGPEQVDYLECHATGTPIGDGTEAESVAAWFGTRGTVPPLGSVKGNLGHLLTVAGLSSLLKVILSMAHGHLPPTIGIDRPLSTPAAGEVPVVRAGRDWPDSGPGPRRAAVSAFGFGGTNAHVVLSQQPDALEAGGAAPVVPPPWTSSVSARTSAPSTASPPSNVPCTTAPTPSSRCPNIAGGAWRTRRAARWSGRGCTGRRCPRADSWTASTSTRPTTASPGRPAQLQPPARPDVEGRRRGAARRGIRPDGTGGPQGARAAPDRGGRGHGDRAECPSPPGPLRARRLPAPRVRRRRAEADGRAVRRRRRRRPG